MEASDYLSDKISTLFQRSRAEGSNRYQNLTKTYIGVVTEDSSNGRVSVEIDGNGTSVSLPTTVDAKNGDSVLITSTVNNGLDALTVTGVVGGGDRLQTDIQGAVEKSNTAVEQSNTAVGTATEASKTASEASTNAAQAISETKDLITLRIDSSRGTVFKNNDIATILTVRCYKRGKEITTLSDLRQALYDPTARIRWYVLRAGDTSWVSVADTSKMLSDDGFTLTISPNDVNIKCTFKAEIVTD